jgi:amino acid adenylation domain-containing protein
MVDKSLKAMDRVDKGADTIDIHETEMRAPILNAYADGKIRNEGEEETETYTFAFQVRLETPILDPGELSLGLFIVVISRYTEQKGLLLSYRNFEKKKEGVLGISLSDDPSFNALVERIHESDLYSWDKMDYASLQAQGGPLTVRFSFGNCREASTLVPLAYEQQDIPVQMDVHFHLDGGQLSGVITYNKELLKESYIVRFVSHMETVLSDVRDKATLPISSLNLISRQEEDLLKKWGRIEEPLEQYPCVHRLFEAQAARSPHSIALSFQGEQMTYRQLNERADALANRIVEAGIEPDQVVVIFAERSLELVTALLGTLKAGGCYLALEPNTPQSRVSYILEDASPKLILTQDRFLDCIPENEIPKLRLDNEETYQYTNKKTPFNTEPGHLAYISYTSGSTGKPKGVCVPHRAVSRLVHQSDFLTVSPEDVFLLLSPVAFDASTLEIWVPLTNGGHLAIYEPAPVTLDQLAKTIKEEGVTTLWLTAGLFHLMVDTHLEAFAGVKHLLAGGDVISRIHLERLLREHSHLTFTNGYGPTENTTFTTCWTTNQAIQEGSIPIGSPIKGTRVAILDANMKLVPIGTQGELYALGAGLARCYLNDPTETEKKFIPSPFTSDPAERMYKTGDLARWREDGTVEFMGRVDFQVKIYGYRVELGEVEAVILRYEGTKEAVVVAQSDPSGGKRLLAYVVPDNTKVKTEWVAELQAFLKEHLPSYMVPWAIIPIEEIPLNANGKVDRSKLPSANRVARRLNTVYTPPRNQTETFLAQLWGKVLAVEPIGIHDNFFLIGGNSLTLAEMTLQIQEQFGIKVPSRVLYLKPTIADLASFIIESDSVN